VLPHEHTRKAAKEDRYKLLKATRANFSPIFLMFSDRQGSFQKQAEATARTPPDFQYTDDGGVAHRVWRIRDGAAVSALQSAIASEKAYIADGHHRWAHRPALSPRSGLGGRLDPRYFTPMEAPGLVVLPYHRLLDRGPSIEEARRALTTQFDVNEVRGAAAAAKTAAQSKAAYAFGLVDPSGAGLVAQARAGAGALLPADAPPSLRALDTFFLHQAVLSRLLNVPEDAVRYAHSMREVEEELKAGKCRLGRDSCVRRRSRRSLDVADARESMPAKSTFFHPKLPSAWSCIPCRLAPPRAPQGDWSASSISPAGWSRRRRARTASASQLLDVVHHPGRHLHPGSRARRAARPRAVASRA